MEKTGNNRLIEESGIRAPLDRCTQGEHGRTGLPRLCIRNHECWHCPFDQWIDEIEGLLKYSEGSDSSGRAISLAA